MKIQGIVIEGKKKGRLYGFPTANIENKGVLPGIYAGEVTVAEKTYIAAIYVGTERDTVLEAHLLDFNDSLYGKEISITVGEKMRDDERNLDHETLLAKIQDDIQKVREMKK